NYLIGRDPRRWHRGVPHYAKVRYRDVYPGIDLVYYGNEGQLETDFMVFPGSDPRSIRFRLEGASGVYIDGRGNLLVATAAGVLTFRKPVARQAVYGRGKEVACGFTTRGSEVGFSLGSYDAGAPLVIDPLIVYSTYIRGNRDTIVNRV